MGNCRFLDEMLRAENLAAAAQPQIFLGDLKAVLGLAHDVEPRFTRPRN